MSGSIYPMTLEELAHNGVTTHGQLTADFQDTFFAAMDPHADGNDRETRAHDASFIELLGTTTEYYPTIATPATFSTQPEKFESQSTGYRSRRPEGALPLVVHEIRDEAHELEHPDEELVMRDHGRERFETAVQPTTPSRRDSFDRIAKRNREADTRFRESKVSKKSSSPISISTEPSPNESVEDVPANTGKSEKKSAKESSKNSAGRSSPKTPRSVHSDDTSTPASGKKVTTPKALQSPTSSSGKKVIEPALKVSTTTFSGLVTTGPAKPGDPCTLHLSEEAKEAVETQVKEQLKQLKEQRRQMETARAVSEARSFDIPGQRPLYGMLEGDGLDSPRALDSPRHHPYPVWPGHHSPGSSSRDSLIERGGAAESPSTDGQLISPHVPVGFVGYVETQLGLGKVLSNRMAMAHTAIQYWAQRASAAGRTADSTPGTAAPGRYDNAHAAMTAATDAATRRHKAEAEAEGLTAIALALYDKWTAIGPASPEKAAAVDIVNTPAANHVQELMNHILRELDSLGGQARRHLSDTLADVIDGQRTDEDAISEARAVLTWFDRARASLRMSFRDQLSHLVVFTPFQPPIKIIQPPSPSARSGAGAYSPSYFAPRSPPISSGPGPAFRAGAGGSAANLASPNSSLTEAGSKKRGNLPKQAVLNLKTWLFEHFEHPYPSEEEKMQLAAETGLSPTQISNWFINARVRIWRPMIEKASNEVEERKSKGDTSPYEVVNEVKDEAGVSCPDEESTRETRHTTHHDKSESNRESHDNEDVDGNAS